MNQTAEVIAAPDLKPPRKKKRGWRRAFLSEQDKTPPRG